MSINGALSADLWEHDDGEWMLNLPSYYTLLSSFFYLREDVIDAGIIGR